MANLKETETILTYFTKMKGRWVVHLQFKVCNLLKVYEFTESHFSVIVSYLFDNAEQGLNNHLDSQALATQELNYCFHTATKELKKRISQIQRIKGIMKNRQRERAVIFSVVELCLCEDHVHIDVGRCFG
jgi:hypothetical protein